MTDGKTEDGGITRSSFLKASAGAAAGVAAIATPAGAVLSLQEQGVPARISSPAPREPVIAYVHDAERGEVTVMAGTSEITYTDRPLVRRLMKAAPQHPTSNGGNNVIAS